MRVLTVEVRAGRCARPTSTLARLVGWGIQAPDPADACRQRDGFRRGAAIYDDGAHFAVDWTNASALRAAIAQVPVKIGVAADALTGAAVRRFQQSNGLTVDGIVGPTGRRPDVPTIVADGICGAVTWQALVSGMLAG